jgi:hypothetical protein
MTNHRNTIIVVEDFQGYLSSISDHLKKMGFQGEPDHPDISDPKKFVMNKGITEVVFLPSYDIAETALHDGMPNLTRAFLDWDLGGRDKDKGGIDLFPFIYNHTNKPTIYLTSSTPTEMLEAIYREHAAIVTRIPDSPLNYLSGGSFPDMAQAIQQTTGTSATPDIRLERVEKIGKKCDSIAIKIASLAQDAEAKINAGLTAFEASLR